MADLSSPAAQRPSRALSPVSDATNTTRILVVDDEDAIRSAVSRFLRSRGFEVVTADSGQGALDVLARQRFQLMICDVRMPGMEGTEVLPRALALDPDLCVMMLTAMNDAPTATEALTQGAMDYLLKPIELGALQDAVERGLHKRDLLVERRRVEATIREEVVVRTRELESEKESLRTLTVRVAETLINAMEAKDVFLRGHSQRVAELGASVAAALGLDDDTIEQVRLAGRLHDVGKIGIREVVLNKPGQLDPAEYAHVKEHVRIGMEILQPLQHIGPALRYVHEHHERWDGTGYPRGLAGEAISIGGRVLCAADAFDAITSQRAYREPLTPQATLELLRAQVGRQLDPRVFEALEAVVMQRNSIALAFIDDLHG